jgi:hypothetical protein
VARPERGPRRSGRGSRRAVAPGPRAAAHRVASPPVTLLALQVADSGVLGNPNLRAAIALAIDRGALSNVIFQKQGEVTASLLPAALTGYSFLFPTARDLNKAHELRGGIAPPPLTMTVEGGGAMQLAAQRIALTCTRRASTCRWFRGRAQHADLVLRRLPLASTSRGCAGISAARRRGQAARVEQTALPPLSKWNMRFWRRNTLIPLLYLPRAYAVGGRVRDLRLAADGAPLLAGASHWRMHHEPADKSCFCCSRSPWRPPWPRWRGRCWCASARSLSSATSRRRRSSSASSSASFSTARPMWPRRWSAWPQASVCARMAFELASPATASPYLTEAGRWPRRRNSTFLRLSDPMENIVSSAQWPARFGYPEPAAAAGCPPATFLKREELPDGSTALGLFAVRAVRRSGTETAEPAGRRQAARPELSRRSACRAGNADWPLQRCVPNPSANPDGRSRQQHQPHSIPSADRPPPAKCWRGPLSISDRRRAQERPAVERNPLSDRPPRRQRERNGDSPQKRVRQRAGCAHGGHLARRHGRGAAAHPRHRLRRAGGGILLADSSACGSRRESRGPSSSWRARPKRWPRQLGDAVPDASRGRDEVACWRAASTT